MPRPVRVPPDHPRVDQWNHEHDAEKPIDDGHPYRSAPGELINVDSVIVTEARFSVIWALSKIERLIEGRPVDVPRDFDRAIEDPLSRVYWYGHSLATEARRTCDRAAQSLTRYTPQGPEYDADRHAWLTIGDATVAAMEFIHKHATGNLSVCSEDGAANAVLRKVALTVGVFKPTDDLVDRILNVRLDDAAHGTHLSFELKSTIKDAFEAAWIAGEFDFAYGLIDTATVLGGMA
jgi:hypothetical protein